MIKYLAKSNMINSNNALVFIVSIILFTSCVNSTLETAPWNNAQVPVVFSILTPDETVKAYLGKTYNQYIQAEKTPYPEAQVFICGADSNWVQLTRITPDTTFFEDAHHKLVVEMGKSYNLKIVLKNSIVRASTTIVDKGAVIKNLDCEIVKSYKDSSDWIFENGVMIAANTLKFSAKFDLPTDNKIYYINWSNSNKYDNILVDGNSFTTTTTERFDSTYFTLKLYTFNDIFSKYIVAQNVNKLCQNYSGNSPLIAIIENFGGIQPSFSNIVNGVGLFGSATMDKKRVPIKPLATK